jgi:hypothetical protein
MGVLESDKLGNLPPWLSVSKEKLKLTNDQSRGEELTVFVHPDRTSFEPVKMTVASSISFRQASQSYGNL